MTSAAATARTRMRRVAATLSVSRAKRAIRPGGPDTGPINRGFWSTGRRSLGSAFGERASKATPACWLGAGEETPSKEGSAG
jgi:hypothetical protein